ncbi:O-methyltransferase [Zalerion maritima]|uniref:O-methyltransferase n=1 Tax=Zalerion maritima TaxID=339359 RepID=A0AAD5RUK5_9PEZI|nr:O-methyltransferase [Zalerion maritima]
MAKFKFSSLLHPSSSKPAQSADRTQKSNRQSFSALSSHSILKHQEASSSQASTTNATTPKSTDALETGRSPSRMAELATKIVTETAKVEEYMRDNGMELPGFEVHSPADFPSMPEEVQQSRLEVIHATSELQRLIQGPKQTMRWMIWNFLDSVSLQIIYSYGLALLVPKEGTISLEELASKTTLDRTNLARVLRYAMTSGVFCEPIPGHIGHTSASAALMEDKALADWIGFNSEDIFPSSAHVLKALRAYPEATSLVQTGFNFAFDTVNKEPMFVTFGKDPTRAKRMGGAMASLTGGEGYEVSHLVDGGYDFGDVDARGGTMVDIGGSHGFVCVDLAKKYSNMKFVVQDLPKTVESAPNPVSDDSQVAERIELQAHDFFTEQKVKDADVYFFRWIMHNYSTPYAVKILKNLVPALKPGAKILINDHCVRKPGSETPWDERLIRGMDMVMLTLLNAQERDEEEFKALFSAADDGYVFKGVTRKEGCRMSVVEAVWRPQLVGKGKEAAIEREGKADGDEDMA